MVCFGWDLQDHAVPALPWWAGPGRGAQSSCGCPGPLEVSMARLDGAWSSCHGRGWSGMGFRVSSHPNHSMILWTGRNHFPRAPRLWEGSTNTGFGAPGNTEPLAKGPPAPPLPRVLFPEERAEILSAPTQKWRLLHPMCGNGLSPGQEQCRDTAAPWKHRTSKKCLLG